MKSSGNCIDAIRKEVFIFSVKATLKQHLEEEAYLNQTHLSNFKMKLLYISTQDCPKINTFEKVLFFCCSHKIEKKYSIQRPKNDKKNLAREHFLSSKNYAQA
jgi:hypothetical protein